MLKRLFDIILSAIGLLITSPILIPTLIAIWLQDYHSPFYIAPRVGKKERPFQMVKLRSMVMNADKSGVDSTSANDTRITAVGRFIRRYKLDELSQLWNVLKGDMSLVGPRPNVKRETDIYTRQEKELLSVRPGITDIASIVFADENEILQDSSDPDLDYNQLIRPWKSRLGLLYVKHASIGLDLKLIYLTVLAVASRSRALAEIQQLLIRLQADPELCQVAKREDKLVPHPPPGAIEVVTNRYAPPAQESPSNGTEDQNRLGNYTNVTEQPGSGATTEQLERLYHRYHTAKQYAQDKKILEVACGAGFGLGYLEQCAQSVVGGDYMHDLLVTAQNHYQGRIPLYQIDAHKLPFADNRFDLVFIYEAIYYLHDLNQFCAEVRRILDQEGLFLIGTVNKNWSEFAPSPFSTQYLSVPELKALLETHGFTDIVIYGAFPTESHTLKRQIISFIRRIVIALHLMPDTLEGRERFKRIFYGELDPMPAEVTDGMAELTSSVTLDSDQETDQYKILYAFGRMPERDKHEQSLSNLGHPSEESTEHTHWLDILVCPEDKGPLQRVDNDNCLLNPRTGYRYPIREGIPVLLINEAQ